MKAVLYVLIASIAGSACGPDDANNGSNNGATNNGASNNGASNNGMELPELNPMEAPPEGSWPTFRADPQRTGYNPLATTGRTVAEEVWRLSDINTTTYGAAKGSASVWGDTLYIGSDDARFTAVDVTDGSVLWETTITDTTNGIHGTPSIGPELVYVGAYNGTVHAYDRASGEEVFQYDKGYQIGSSPLFIPEHGRVYTAHEDSDKGGGWVTSIDAQTGEEIWAYRFGAHAHSSVAIDMKNELIFVGDNAAILRCWDVITGEKKWDYKIPQTGEEQSDIKSTPMVIEAKDLVVAGAWSRKVHAWNVHTGEIAWEYDTGGSRIMSSTAYAPGREVVYAGTLGPGRSVVALDADDGTELWATQLGGSVLSSPAVNGDESLVVVGSHDGFVYALDAETGAEVWSHEIVGKVSSSPTLVGDMVYVAAANGDLVALRTE